MTRVLCGGKANADGIEVHVPTKKAPRHGSYDGTGPEAESKLTRARHIDRMPSLNGGTREAVEELRACLQGAADRLEEASRAHGEALHAGTNDEHRRASENLIAARKNFRQLNTAAWRKIGRILEGVADV